MHVTTAGTVATWWFVPDEASAWWSQALSESLARATTYSFGSICFGSFIVAFVQALRAVERHARGQEDLGMVLCVVDCILGCLQSIIEYFNKVCVRREFDPYVPSHADVYRSLITVVVGLCLHWYVRVLLSRRWS
jgi:uncharacterized membrane protein YidH (DUF202 family)